jgi:hypothetical protein
MEPLILGETVRTPDLRRFYDMRGVIADREWLETTKNFKLYYMYRELAWNEEEQAYEGLWVKVRYYCHSAGKAWKRVREDCRALPPKGSEGRYFL